jgi:hypothetical protein
MLRHDHVCVNAESETAPHTLQRSLKDSFCGVDCQQLLPVITGEGNKVAVPGFLKSLQSPWHEVRLGAGEGPTQAKRRLEWGTVRELDVRLGNREYVSDRETESRCQIGKQRVGVRSRNLELDTLRNYKSIPRAGLTQD